MVARLEKCKSPVWLVVVASYLRIITAYTVTICSVHKRNLFVDTYKFVKKTGVGMRSLQLLILHSVNKIT